jgi:hypothetical protein
MTESEEINLEEVEVEEDWLDEEPIWIVDAEEEDEKRKDREKREEKGEASEEPKEFYEEG